MRTIPAAIAEALKAKGIVPAKRSKYNAVPTIVNGIRFPSKAQAEYYRWLLLEKELIILHEVPIRLPGGDTYRIDFVTLRQFPWKEAGVDARLQIVYAVRWIEVKGAWAPGALKKVKQAEAALGVHIDVLKAIYRNKAIIGFDEVER